MTEKLAFHRTRLNFLGLFVLFLTTSIVIGQVQAATGSAMFIQKGMIGDQFEISSSQLALQNSQNQKVKDFAQMMVDDHTKNASNMKAVIATANADSVQPTPGLDKSHQHMLDKLGKLQGPDFDKEYVKDQTSAHKDAIALYKDYSRNGDNAQLKSFAHDTLPTLKSHQAHLTDVKASM